jgi:hypothetical protein
MFSILKNKTPKTISHQTSTPLKRLAFSLLMAFSLFSYSANATEIKPIAFSTDIDISEGTSGTVVILTHPDHPATTVFSNTFENLKYLPASNLNLVVAPITSFTPSTGAAGTVVTISDSGGNFLLGQSVTLNGVLIPAINVTFIDATTLNITIPCGASTGKFSVDGGTDSTLDFTVTALNGTVSGGSTICANVQSGPLAWTGANGTNIIWQFSTDEGANWDDILGTDGDTSYTPNLLIGTTSYRVMVTIGGCPSPSAATEVIVTEPINGGNLALDDLNDATVCENTTVVLNLTGQEGTITRWESSTDQGANWIAIPNTIGLASYTTGQLTETTDFRVFIENGGCDTGVYSNVEQIIVAKTPISDPLSTSSSPI